MWMRAEVLGDGPQYSLCEQGQRETIKQNCWWQHNQGTYLDKIWWNNELSVICELDSKYLGDELQTQN